MELNVEDKKDMSATRMLGVLARHMDDKADSKTLLKWKKLATMPNATVAPSTATTDELMDAFVLSHPMPCQVTWKKLQEEYNSQMVDTI